MPRRRAISSPDSTHKTIEEAQEFINSKMKKHSDVIQYHTNKLKYYRQIKDTLDGEVRWRNNNLARVTGRSAKSSSKKKTSSNTQKRSSRLVPLLQPVKKEEVEEDEPSVTRGRGRKVQVYKFVFKPNVRFVYCLDDANL